MRQLFRIDKKLDDLVKIKALTILQHYSKAKNARQNEFKSHATLDLFSSLSKLHNNRLKSAFAQLKTGSLKHKHDKALLKHTILNCLNSRLRHFFSRWRETMRKEDIANLVNTEGPVAIELDKARK